MLHPVRKVRKPKELQGQLRGDQIAGVAVEKKTAYAMVARFGDGSARDFDVLNVGGDATGFQGALATA